MLRFSSIASNITTIGTVARRKNIRVVAHRTGNHQFSSAAGAKTQPGVICLTAANTVYVISPVLYLVLVFPETPYAYSGRAFRTKPGIHRDFPAAILANGT
jgi:hypothetical protein